MITKQTAVDIALSYREIETAEKLLADVTSTLDKPQGGDIRDAFGRPQNSLQLSVPTGESRSRLFDVPLNLAKTMIEAHIAHHRTRLSNLNEQAYGEARVTIFCAPAPSDDAR